MHFFNEHMWSHAPVKGEGSAALCSWEICLSVWFMTMCSTLHIATSPHHCAANHAVNCKNPTDLTRCDAHEYYQMNCCCSVSHRTACYAWFVAMDNVQHTANLEHNYFHVNSFCCFTQNSVSNFVVVDNITLMTQHCTLVFITKISNIYYLTNK